MEKVIGGLAVRPWCDAKDVTGPDGYGGESYCTCNLDPDHEEEHQCWGCQKKWIEGYFSDDPYRWV